MTPMHYLILAYGFAVTVYAGQALSVWRQRRQQLNQLKKHQLPEN